MRVLVRNNRIEDALKILNNKLKDEGLFRLLKDKEHFISKSNKRKTKRKHSIIRIKKAEKQREKIFARKEQNMISRQMKNQRRNPNTRKS